MPGLIRTLITSLAVCASGAAIIASAAHGAEGAPIGFWRATNDCFLAVFLLTDNGHAQTAYQSGEQEENAAWTWDGSTLMITSPMFPEDQFTAHIADDHVQADYVWHDLERDQLNRQACVFERVMPTRL
jgi:hypothetical protein